MRPRCAAVVFALLGAACDASSPSAPSDQATTEGTFPSSGIQLSYALEL